MQTFYTKIPDAEYHALPILSQSYLKVLIDHTYKHFEKSLKNKKKTESMNFGNLAHSVTLENLDISSMTLVDNIDGRTKEGKEQAKKLQQESEWLFKSDYEALVAMKSNFDGHAAINKIMGSARFIEHYGIADIYNQRNPENKVYMKFKPDIVGEDFLADYKTIGEHASDRNCAKAMKNYHYPFQAATYLHLDAILTGNMKRKYFIIFQESVAPYGCKVIQLDPETLESGYTKFDLAIRKYIDGLNRPEKQTANYEGITEIPLLYY